MKRKIKGVHTPLQAEAFSHLKKKKRGGNKTAALKTESVHHIYYQFHSLEWKLQVL